ncbi:MAG: hypothetical protein M1161_02365 [Candidatus Thermoplasmatota archaeon]|jgi:hypothetical protein|nr:hypothetical protein [Candidatus Thermoplasmatota archaeon]
MMKDEEITILDAYDQGRKETNERFIEILKQGIRETGTRKQLMDFIVREIDTSRFEKVSCNDCD